MSMCRSEVSGACASVAVGERHVLPLAPVRPLAEAPWRRPTSRAMGAAGVGTPTAFALATGSALAYAAGFPPLSWSIAPWLALAPLLVACAGLSPWRAAMAGMWWAVVAGLGVVWFLPAMLSRYFGLAAAPSWLATGAIVGAFHGVPVSLYAAWVAWLARRRAASPILLAGGWLACEFARAHGGLGSPWALAAYSQVYWTPLIQIADLAGPYGIGMLVAGVNACVAAWWVPALRGRRPRLAGATIAAALMSVCLYGQWRLGQTFAEGPAVQVAVVQGGAPPADAAQRAANLAGYVELTRSAAPQADLIVWPESAVTAYMEEPSSTRDTVLRLAGDTGADVILGGPHYTPSSSGTRYHNSAYLVRDGRVAARYDKHRLVPFAEDGRFSWLFGDKTTSYTPGLGAFVLPATALRVGAFLCVEAMFPDLVLQAVRQGAEVLVNLSNDAWFGHAAPARQQLEIATLRAVENRRYLVRAAATGFSAVVDPYGRTLVESAFDADQVLNATVRASHARTPYQRWGDAFAWLVMAGVAGASIRSLIDTTEHQHRRRFV
jgi:apolipoprotein N-acyltransferase